MAHTKTFSQNLNMLEYMSFLISHILTITFNQHKQSKGLNIPLITFAYAPTMDTRFLEFPMKKLI